MIKSRIFQLEKKTKTKNKKQCAISCAASKTVTELDAVGAAQTSILVCAVASYG